MNLESYFTPFRNRIIGIDAWFESPYGKKKLIYADWIAGGRLYEPIEDLMKNRFGPMVGNTHSESSEVGTTMTMLYKEARNIIKTHVNAEEGDCLLSVGSGMTGAVNKLMRILGLSIPDQAEKFIKKEIPEEEIPIVFITYMEHHSNHTDWLESIADVVILEPEEDYGADLATQLLQQLEKYKNRKLKIGSFSAGSNVTGIIPDYHQLAEIMHQYNGYAFADFAASAPYVSINMHPENKSQSLDAIFFSPHKALGGPGSCGILVFNKRMYKNKRPDQPGGGTVLWTNRWNEYAYFENIEAREDGGTPPYLQTIRTALVMKLKEEMGVDNILKREHELLEIAFRELEKMPEVHILAKDKKDRLGVISFYVPGIHHNLIVKLLSDHYGIQVRGGCSCAGTYGHFLLKVSKEESHRITHMIDEGDLSEKPGWVRLSLHPTMTNEELLYIIRSLKDIIINIEDFKKDYAFEKCQGEFYHLGTKRKEPADYHNWFNIND